MKVLVTNDDGIRSPGLWTLVGELKKTADVTVVAPAREQSAIGTAVTLFADLKVSRTEAPVPDVKAYAVEGTPGDCVILALSELVADSIDIVISGINLGPNVGDDVLISGTVAGALQGYLHGSHALAVSQQSRGGDYLDDGARLTAQLVSWLASEVPPDRVFLNVNLPARPAGEIGGVRITRLASDTHVHSVETGNGGRPDEYRLVRRQRENHTAPQTDVWALQQGHVSLTLLHRELLRRTLPDIPEELEKILFAGLKNGRKTAAP